MFSFLNRAKDKIKDAATNYGVKAADVFGKTASSAINQRPAYEAAKIAYGAATQQPQQQPQQQQSRPSGALASVANNAKNAISKAGQDYQAASKLNQQFAQQPQQPQRQLSQQPQAQTSQSLSNQYINDRGLAAESRIGAAQDSYNQQAELQRQLAESRMGTLTDIGNQAGQAFDKYSQNLLGGLDIQRGTAQRQAGETEQQYMDQLRFNEQAGKERMKNLENTLAGLGTLQSSSFGNLGAKVAMGTERQNVQSQRQMNSRIADIQDTVRSAEQQVNTLIQQEGARYQQQVAQLAGQMDQNSIEFKQAVSSLADKANERINGILDGLDQFTYNAQLEMMQQQTPGDVIAFDEQGNPANTYTQNWMFQNPDKYEEALKMQGFETGLSQDEARERQQTMNLVDSLMTRDLSGVSGLFGRTGLGSLFGKGAENKGDINQLIARLALDERGKLKGQGTITDQETAMLEAAVSKLKTPGLSQDAIRRELQNIKTVLEGGVPDYQSNNMSLESFME